MNFSTKAPTCPTQAVVAAREFLLDVAELACQKNRVIAELFLSKFSKQAAHTAIFNAKTLNQRLQLELNLIFEQKFKSWIFTLTLT